MTSLPINHEFKEGDAIGQYVVKRLLGAGGMGSVYHAVHKDLDELAVAIKVLKVDSSASKLELVERLFEECRALARLESAKHPALVGVKHVDTYRGLPYLTMPFVEGRSLDVLIEEAKVTESEAVRICGETADALAVAHAMGIVHRDVKPKNIMVTGDGQVKVIDFGISKIIENNPGLTGIYNSMFGSMQYMAPERLESIIDDQKRIDEAKGDVYSLGVMLYECVTNGSDFPTEERTPEDTIRKYLAWRPKDLRNPDINRLVKLLMERDPQKRLTAKQSAFLLNETHERLTTTSQTGYFRKPGRIDIDMLIDYIEGDGNDLFGVRDAVGPLVFVRDDLYVKLSPGVEVKKNQLLTTESRGKDAYTLGRGEACDIILRHDSVSREHAVIGKDGDSHFIIDKSSNGTLVDDKRLVLGKKVPLVVGQRVRFARAGSYVFASSAESLRSLKRAETNTRRLSQDELDANDAETDKWL